MSSNAKSLVNVVSNEYFNAQITLDGQDMVLEPKVPGKLKFSDRVEVESVPADVIFKDSDGNINLGVDKGASKNTIKGEKNIIAGSLNESASDSEGNFISGGSGNKVYGDDSSIIAGITNTCRGDRSVMSGTGNTLGANSLNSAIIGGQNNVNDKVGSVILGGYNITAYRDNTAYVPDLKVEGSQIFGVDPISRKIYGEFNRVFDDGTSMVVPHATTHGADEAYAGYIKLVYCGTPDSEGSITSAKFNETSLTCDGTWKEAIITAQEGGMQIVIAGAGTFSYTAEINESVIEVVAPEPEPEPEPNEGN